MTEYKRKFGFPDQMLTYCSVYKKKKHKKLYKKHTKNTAKGLGKVDFIEELSITTKLCTTAALYIVM